ncbi:MAG: hypothetical protein HGA96_16845, partial [Desulfobulbaceae bacterium]|nr:hypothetical protein [Desulfobulbaceae bacterium]
AAPQASQSFPVAKATPVLTWATPAAITYKTALSATQLKASSGGVAGTFVYTPAAGTVLTAGADQTLSVTFTPTSTANYNSPAAQTVLLTVNKATPVITWPAPAAITYGTALSATQLRASSGGVAGTWLYTPAAGTVLEVGANQTLAVSFAPSDLGNYETPAAKTVLITVNAAVPTANPTAPAAPLVEPDSLGVFSNGDWSLDLDENGTWEAGRDFATSFGAAGMLPVVGDWNGDGYSELGAYRDGSWYLDLNGNGVWDDVPTDLLVTGYSETDDDLPVVGDWNGDGVAEIGIYRPSDYTWHLDYAGSFRYNATGGQAFGFADCLPVVGDWNGDGRDKIGVYHDGQWQLDSNGNQAWDGSLLDTLVVNFGGAGLLPVAGDWSGSGVDRIGVYDNGTWYLDLDGNGVWHPALDQQKGPLGETGMLPVVGNW